MAGTSDLIDNQHAAAKRIGFLYEHRSALRSTFRFGFAGIPSAPKGVSSGVRTAVLMGANRTKKTQQTPFSQPAWFACCDRPCLGSLCWVKCFAGRCLMLRAVQRWGARARVSPLRFSWALIEQRNRNKPHLRNWLGLLAAIDLVLARCVSLIYKCSWCGVCFGEC